MRRRGFVGRVLVTGLAVLLLGNAFAVSWQWKATEDGITSFRYQVDGEYPSRWTVVDSSVTKYDAGDLGNSSSPRLYVQQSKDGTTWSDSLVMGTAGKHVDGDRPRATGSHREHGIAVLVGGGVNLDTVLATSWFHDNNYVQPDLLAYPSVSVDYVVGMRPRGWGMRAGLGYVLYDPLKFYRYHALDLHVLGTYGFAFGKVGLDLSLGLKAMIPTVNLAYRVVQAFDFSEITIFYGPMMGATLRFDLGIHMQLLVQMDTSLLLRDALVPYGLRENICVGLCYWF